MATKHPHLPTVPSRGAPTHAPLCTTELDLDAQRPTDYDCRCFFLHRPRAELYRRIDGRVEEMMASGLLTVGVWCCWATGLATFYVLPKYWAR